MTTEGKTKRIIPGPEKGTVILETKDELTGGDAAKRVQIEGISIHKTTQAANAFRYLKQQEIPVAFIEQSGPRELLCYDCEMIPLELVMRRFAWGSVLKRESSLKQADGKPFRFENVRTEMFHKWAAVMPPNVTSPVQMEEGAARDKYLREGVWAVGVYTDPYVDVHQGVWTIHSAKDPFSRDKALMKIQPTLNETEREFVITKLMIPCFLALEKAWAKVETEHGQVALADMKVEVGRKKADGQLVIADVIDNDSWRIWPGGDPTKQLDKQNFRDGSPLSAVSDNYVLVAELTKGFLS